MMNNRQHMRPANDQAIFKRTATKTKKINLGIVTYRGGIRL